MSAKGKIETGAGFFCSSQYKEGSFKLNEFLFFILTATVANKKLLHQYYKIWIPTIWTISDSIGSLYYYVMECY